MPTVLRIKGYRIGFYSSDFDEPLHVHADKAGHQAKFWLEPLQLAKNAGFSRNELNKIYDILRENRQELLRKWNEYFR
ncbi:MAG TPA: DUF4160 domain-containing protein [Verrucomicrobiae bacterium]